MRAIKDLWNNFLNHPYLKLVLLFFSVDFPLVVLFFYCCSILIISYFGGLIDSSFCLYKGLGLFQNPFLSNKI